MTERDFALDVVRTLQREGYQALFAGGCVRDELLGLAPADYDIASNAVPEQVANLFRRTIHVGAAFGVVEVVGPRQPDGSHFQVQVATFRNDGHYSDGRRPDSVTFSTAPEDAHRRDFTINALFLDPVSGQILDYVHGRADLEAKILRAVGDPVARFTEDKLRILRAVRMAARFELSIDPATASAARLMAGQIRSVSAERIADELRKLLTNRHRQRGGELLESFGLSAVLFPEVDRPNVELLGLLPESVSFPLAFAAYLADVPPKTVASIGRRLKLATDEIRGTEWLVANRKKLFQAKDLRPSQRHPLLTHPQTGELLQLLAADGATSDAEFCWDLLRNTPPEQLNPRPVLTGDDLIARGWRAGPVFKRVLDAVWNAQLDGTIRTMAEAVALAEQIRDQ